MEFRSKIITNRVITLLVLVLLSLSFVSGQQLSAEQLQKVTILNNQEGCKLQIDGKDFMVLGMNWGYMPIGKNYSYNFWGQSDEFIKSALANELTLLRSMGVNTIRHYIGIPARWVQYIYETYGIYTVINHPLGRYGLTIDGVWNPNTDYSDERVRKILKAEMESYIEEFKDTPGMLFWLLGNENNYGLTWSSAETEALPEGERHSAKARYLYSLFGEVTDLIKSKDSRLVAIANGDLQYIDIIKEELNNLDIFGSNMYRGISARDAFEVVKEKMNIPFMFTEFGSDAFNAKTLTEDQPTQARYLIGQWKEIYEQSYGKGRVGNAIGGFTFQFTDGWWKYKQEENLDIHDINASWPNGGYSEDFVEGENNMNEEWWGICAKGFPDASGLHQLYPRAAYFALKKAYILDPYGRDCSLETIRAHFANITPMEATIEARGSTAALGANSSDKVRLKSLRMEFETISTGGKLVSTPENYVSDTVGYPTFRGFDRMESYYTEIEAKPSANIRGSLTLNYIGNVAENPIDEIFYENRGRVKTVQTKNGFTELEGIERLKVYNASVSWVDKWFNLEGFYRTGHYHWGYHGDFFGLYREANYGPNLDTYNGEAPMGMEITFKKQLNGLTVAMGPELWWGANPAVLLKYQRKVGRFNATAVFQEDIDEKNSAVTSSAIPIPSTRKATLHLETKYKNINIELGGIWSGDNKIGMPFQFMKNVSGNDEVWQDFIETQDAFGGKIKLMHTGRISWYVQGAIMGIVANGGPTAIQTFTGWWLKDNGSGNQRNLLAGFSTRFGNLEVAPNFIWQKPIVGPMPANSPQPGHLRNVNAFNDPFEVRGNREMTAGELVLTYDPTPATWMYHWDSDVREDAWFAATFGMILKDLPTSMDASNGFLSDGSTIFAFPNSTPARKIGSLSNLFQDHIWELYTRIVTKPKPGLGVITNLVYGTGEPNGDDPRLIKRYKADVRMIYGSTKLQTIFQLNDWGPYDYHKDFNLTYPVQMTIDLSTVSGIPKWFELPQTRLGVRFTYRTLDQYSPRYNPPTIPGPGNTENFDLSAGNGNEWEIRTYLHLNVGM